MSYQDYLKKEKEKSEERQKKIFAIVIVVIFVLFSLKIIVDGNAVAEIHRNTPIDPHPNASKDEPASSDDFDWNDSEDVDGFVEYLDRDNDYR